MKKILLGICSFFITLYLVFGFFVILKNLSNYRIIDGLIIAIFYIGLVVLDAFLLKFTFKSKSKNIAYSDDNTNYDKNIGADEVKAPIQNNVKTETINYSIAEIPVLQIDSELFNIPADVLELLWINNKNYSNNNEFDRRIGNICVDEPSLIDLSLDIDINIDEEERQEDIGYYPSYENLFPKQRYIYLKWLEDVSQPIPIGYVFIFYYGLERHLLYGDFVNAFNMILKLRKYHHNSSFLRYSSDALLIAGFKRKSPDLIMKIDYINATTNILAFVFGMLFGKYNVDILIGICKNVGFTNMRYIKNDIELFKKVLTDLLVQKYGEPYYTVTEDDFSNAKGNIDLIIANYSLKMEDRFETAPDITTNPKIKNEVFELLSETHEKVKSIKKELRKKINK